MLLGHAVVPYVPNICPVLLIYLDIVRISGYFPKFESTPRPVARNMPWRLGRRGVLLPWCILPRGDMVRRLRADEMAPRAMTTPASTVLAPHATPKEAIGRTPPTALRPITYEQEEIITIIWHKIKSRLSSKRVHAHAGRGD